MNRTDLQFNRPEHLAATAPPETRGLRRDRVRLLVTTATGHTHSVFHRLDEYLQPGDLLVVNASATLPASLPAMGPVGKFLLNLSTDYGGNLWLAEPRWSAAAPGPLPLEPGQRINAAGLPARLIFPFPGLPRLWFVQFEADVRMAMARAGSPIRYGYIQDPPGLDAYQTIFAHIPGSAEMPSAGRPFTRSLLRRLEQRGIELAPILLHTGVSSLEVEAENVEEHPLYPEPFVVPAATAKLVNATHRAGGRVIAVGTTVVRALESAWVADEIVPVRGFTQRYITPAQGVRAVDGLITGLHDPVTSHLMMLYAIAGKERIQEAYGEAVREGYLWHEFGDSHLILRTAVPSAPLR